jgi:2-dehydro-3-deoxyphosphogluconate aldolase/(4S)-4-hydroxy-2-oxoglutarate aldolase
MTKQDVLRKIAEVGLVPVVRAQSADEAMKVVDAICAGGVPILEITMTVPGAIDAMEQVSRRFGSDVVLGAGTVLDPETARACILAGAQFVVSPALNLKTIEICRRYSVAVVPGALTPTEVVTAWTAGADVVELIPTGGVSVKTAADFIKAGALALGVGADLVDTKAVREGNAKLVTEKAREYLRIVQEARSTV